MSVRTCLFLSIVLIAAACAPAVAGKYYLAFWRETGWYEKGGTGGMHMVNVHVWDEYGNPLANKAITTSTGSSLGTTNANGQVEVDVWATADYSFMVNDPGSPSDVTPTFTTRRMPDWGHYCWECGFIYRADGAGSSPFDTTWYGTLNSTTTDAPCPSPVMSAPCTKSMAFYSCRPDNGYYCSDPQSPGGSSSSVGQTFKASGNRVVACKVHVLGGFGTQYVARIREGGPTGAYVGGSALSPVTGEYEFSKTLTKWGVEGVPVTPGNTYYLEITRSGEGNIQAYRVTNNSYSFGSYYEGGVANTSCELKGHVVCGSFGPTAPGSLTGNVKSANGQNLVGATVTLSPGGLNATTNSSGNYAIADVPPGGYTATASKSGYTDSATTVAISSSQATTQNFTLCTTGIELLSNGGFTSGCTGWSHSESPSNIYWGCGNKAYPGTSGGAGGHSWNAYLACGGTFCDRSFTGDQRQDNVPVSPGACYTASAQVYYEPVLHAGVAADQKERIVLIFNDGAATHASDWHTHTTSNGWDRVSLSGIVPAGMTKVTFKVEVSHTDGQWSGTGAIDECSLQSTIWGTISGYVRDNAGNAISGATVSTNTGGYTTTTAANGSYTLSSVIVGLYTLTATKTGWQSQVQSNKQVIANSTITVSFNLTDSSAPTTPVVTDDGVYTTSTLQLHASWTASDPQTGIAEYQYAIGTSSGATNVVNWTSTGTTASVTRTGLALSTASAYYISVKARNADGMWSTAGNSNGIRPARELASVRDVKSYADGDCVYLGDRVVSAVYGDCIYIADINSRLPGIRVTGATWPQGSTVNVTGVLSSSGGERVITQARVD